MTYSPLTHNMSIDISPSEKYVSGLDVVGRQEPHYNLFNPEADYTHARRCVELYSKVGNPLLPWQIAEIYKYLAIEKGSNPDDRKWLHRNCGLVMPRQNGKTESMFAVLMYKLFVLNERVYFTTQAWKAAEQHWKSRLSDMFNHPALKGMITGQGCSSGNAYLYLNKGGMLLMRTRSKGADRGTTNIDTLIYDEAFDISPAEQASLDSLQKTARNPQTYYLSSPVNATEHEHGKILSNIRDRAYTKKPANMAYAEWTAPDDMDRGEQATWIYSNASLGAILPISNIYEEYEKVCDDVTRANFDIETLGRGDWWHNGEIAHTPILDIELWNSLIGDPHEAIGDSAIGIDISPDGEHASIASATRVKGGTYISLHEITAFDRKDIIRAVKQAVEKNDPVAVVVDDIGRASTLMTELEDAGIEPVKPGVGGVSASLELFLTEITEREIIHAGDERLRRAIETAQFRKIGNDKKRALQRGKHDITPLVASTFALWGLDTNEIKQVKSPKQPVPFVKPKVTRRPDNSFNVAQFQF